MSAGKYKSELPSTPVDFDLAIANRVRDTVQSVLRQNPNAQHICIPIASLKELLDSWYVMSGRLHHFLKYHAADADADA